MRGQRWSFILAVLYSILFVGTAIGFALGLLVLGIYFPAIVTSTHGAVSSSELVLWVCDVLVVVFLFVWTTGLVAELQRSEVIDFRKMLFLPVPLRLVFLLNFAVSLISPGTIFFMLPLVGFTLGLTIAYGPVMVLTFPLGVAFYFTLAGWTYYVRGILVYLMENKRRRRTLLVLITMGFALIGQLPALMNFTILSWAKDHAGSQARPGRNSAFTSEMLTETVLAANSVIPIGWFPVGMSTLIDGRVAVPAFAFLGLTGLGLSGLGLGYRSTLLHYTGKGRGRKRRVARPGSRACKHGRAALVTRKIPLLDPETSAFTIAAFLGYLRHPQIRMQLVFPVVVGAIMLLYFRQIGSGVAHGAFMRTLAPIGVAIWPVLTMGHFIFNVFGIDAEGFRTLVLLPTNRAKYLFAKNLALLPITGGIAAIFLVLCALLMSYTALSFVQSILHVLLVYALFCIVGNFISVYAPYRIRYQGRQALQSGGWVRTLAVLAIFPLGFVSALLALLPAGVSLALRLSVDELPRWAGTAAGLLTAALLIGCTVLLYALSVRAAGRQLLIREQTILETLVKDRE